MKFLIFIYFLSFNLFGQIEGVKYNFECCSESLEQSSILFFSDIEKDVLNNFGVKVSHQEEISEGQKIYEKFKKENNFIDGTKLINLNKILNKILLNLPYQSSYEYKVFLVDSDELNAFTIGGLIFMTNAIYDFCESNDQIALIIAHEIAHNELNHINEKLKRIKSGQSYFGENSGVIINNISFFVTISFNQKNEVHADMFGADLLKLSQFNLCYAILIWKKMEELKGQKTPLIFSSHPYSKTRLNCLMNHIKTNYDQLCY